MKYYVFWLALLVPAPGISSAQNLRLGYFGETITHYGLKGAYEVPLAGSVSSRNAAKRQLYGSIGIAGYRHPQNHLGVIVSPEIGFRRIGKRGALFEFAIAPSYFRYFLEGRTFEATSDGDFQRVRFAAGLTSCKDKDAKPREDQTLFLRHKGADMPIWVKGNSQAKKIVLFVHGGPGDCAMCYRYYLKDLEEDVMMAYWDQRVAGASSGKVDPATLRYGQFGEDMQLVIRLLKKQYPDTEVYLLAHSFGVELAWQYLTTGNNQQQVAGTMIVR